MQKLSFSELCDRLQVIDDTLILTHTTPDADTIGSALALKTLLSTMGCRTFVLCSDPMPQRLKFLTDALEDALVQSDITESDIPSDFVPSRIIAVDVASPKQLGKLCESYENRVDIMIDHHGRGTPYADNYIDPDMAAAGEIVYEISRELLRRGAIKAIPEGVDYCLYAAISSDTGCFRFSNVTPETHIRASEILRSGIDTADINHKLFESKSAKLLKLEARATERLKLFLDGKVALIDMPSAIMRELGVTKEDLGTLIEIARGVEGAMIGIVIKETDDLPPFRVSMRSNCDFDVSEICAVFGGGGHKRAAGCNVEAVDTDEAAELLISLIKKKLTIN